MKNLIKDIKPVSPTVRWLRKYVINKYGITIVAFLVWMTLFDQTSFLVINGMNQEISKYEEQLDYYKTEYQKNDSYYKKLMNNKDEKEKFARENYFMKKHDEEIFILVVDSSRLKPRK
ncbi:FtsB family cell division protein [Chryseobacterium lacus]|uniref:FtsB family cell division protein n=1 Tax=Chryseobacterium lacus TaxID=2058346 RepID=UPI000F87CC23|nr:septum formation initiator family protein [Chryseobacterium lacus]RST26852.1 septum formation initiator family protein [Chryseobacterium lacus]